MTDYRMDVPVSAGRRTFEGFRGLSWALPVLLAGGLAEANSVRATPEITLDGSRFALEITLDDPARSEPIDAWVGIGPDKGMVEETFLRGSFLVDPGGLRVGARRSPARDIATPPHVCFLGLSQGEDWATARVILFLEQGRGQSWLIGARLWDPDRNEYTTVGRAVLTSADPDPSPKTDTRREPRTSGIPVDFEWRAASSPEARDGLFRLFRGVGAERELLLERSGLNNGTQTLSHLRVGVVNSAHQPRGTRGTLLLDDFSLSRSFGPDTGEN